MGVGSAVAWFFCTWRDWHARMLVRAGVSPNALTIFGTVCTCLAGACMAVGAGSKFAWTLCPGDLRAYQSGAYMVLAAVFLFFCSAGDMLDGAVARIGKQSTKFGAFLDSTLDRFSDFAIYLGIAFYFVLRGNVTYTLLPFLAVFWGQMISYTRARAEDVISNCTVGYWQRGERVAAVLIATVSHNIPALLWQQALSPAFTVWARIHYTSQVARGLTPQIDPRQGPWYNRLRLWRYPRMTLAYDVLTGLNIAWLIFAPIPVKFDPLAKLLGLH